MSVEQTFEMKCPGCGDDTDIQVKFVGTCRLVGEGSEDVGDHEWGDESDCWCGCCGKEGKVSDFRTSGSSSTEAARDPE